MQQTLSDLFTRLSIHHADTVRHLNSVRDLTYMLARKLNYGEGHAEAIALAGMLHDIGKLYIPKTILDAPRKLEPEEWTVIHAHPLIGAAMATDMGYDRRISEWIGAHHERLDGSGYPYARTDVPPEALVIATTDIWDATGALRPYRVGFTPQSERIACLREQRARIGHDPVEAFIELLGTHARIPEHNVA